MSKFNSPLPCALTLACVALLAGCASAPVPEVPDGTSRTPVNDPLRVAQFEQKVKEDQAAQAERMALQIELQSLGQQFNDLKNVVRVGLLMPLTSPTPPSPPPIPPTPLLAKAMPVYVAPTISSTTLPPRSFDSISGGVVFRQFYDTGRVDFAPSVDFSISLLSVAQASREISIRGYTDNVGADDINRRLSAERASKVRAWLIASGVDAQRINIRAGRPGAALSDNDTEAGKTLNRRVEIELTEISAPVAAALRAPTTATSESKPQ